MEKRIKVGDTYRYSFSFKQEDVIRFAEATGDFNPVHLDPEYASGTIFKRTIVHGFLGGSVFSKVFGTIFPGKGTLYLNQSMNFYKPMFVEKDYSALFKVTEVTVEKNRARVRTSILDSSDAIIIDGEALIKHDDIY